MASTELAALLDRRDIDDVLVRYTTALDTRQWDLLDAVFAPDAAIDYSASGGITGGPGDLKRWFVEEAFVPFTSWQHLLSNLVVELHGDRATSRSSVYNPLAFTTPEGTSGVLHVGAWYDDELVRTSQGWRIAKRTLGMSWTDGPFPPGTPDLPGSAG